jgi:sensor histidine kinase YesM
MKKVAKEKTVRIILHILVWAVILGLPVYAARKYRMGSDFLLNYYTFAALNAFIFYLNYLVLVPALFFRKKRYKYFISALVLVIFFYFISDFASSQINNRISINYPEQINRQEDERRAPRRPPLRPGIFIAIPYARFIGYASSSLFMVFLSLGLRLLEHQSKIEKIEEEAEKSKLNAELAFLKNQISPHFFFNTLNNIYSLIDRNAEDSKSAIIKLARLMRYVLNETGQDYKHLSEEIEFMANYIDLMKLRIGEKTRLNVKFPEQYNNIMIPHLLFVSLIENAFKYGVSVQEESDIDIFLECGESFILFRCVNSLPDSLIGADLASTGIGLDNLKKRLKLLYPGRHEFNINKTKSTFEVNLMIQLKS